MELRREMIKQMISDDKFSIAVNNGEPECKESPCCISLTLNVPEGKKND